MNKDKTKTIAAFMILLMNKCLKNFDHEKYPKIKESVLEVIRLFENNGTTEEFKKLLYTTYSNAQDLVCATNNKFNDDTASSVSAAIVAACDVGAGNYIENSATAAASYIAKSSQDQDNEYQMIIRSLLKIILE